LKCFYDGNCSSFNKGVIIGAIYKEIYNKEKEFAMGEVKRFKLPRARSFAGHISSIQDASLMQDARKQRKAIEASFPGKPPGIKKSDPGELMGKESIKWRRGRRNAMVVPS